MRNLSFILLIISSSTTYAASYKEAMAAAKSAIDRSIRSREEIKPEVQKLETEADRLQKRLSDIETGMKKLDSRDSTQAGIYLSAQAESKKIRDELEKLGVKIDRADAELQRADVAVQASSEAPKAADVMASVEKLQLELNSVRLQTDFMRLRNRLASTDQTLDAIEHKLDKSVLGAYMQDKIGLLLNSNLMCKATAKCPGGASEVSSELIRQQLFPESSTESVRKSYSDKMKSRTKAR